MKQVRSLLIAAALALVWLVPAVAQVPNFTLPPQTVVGRSANGTGPAQAIPFSQLIAVMLSGGTLTTPTVNTNSVIYKGSVSGQATVSAQSAAGTPTLKWPTGSGTVPSSATSPILLDAVTGIISCPTCATSTAAASPIVASRALAQTLNLSSFTGLVTAGYAAAGDGGGATFQKIASARFVDSTPSFSLTTTGSGCTNGTYSGYNLSGTNGVGTYAVITVSGGIVSSTNISTPGTRYAVGDTVTTAGGFAIPGCVTQPVWTVASVSTPTGSFTDSVGNNWQILLNANNAVSVLAFGAKNDWVAATGDAGATNNTTFIQNCLWFAYGSGVQPTIDAYGTLGATCMLPPKVTMSCALQLPQGVTFQGAGRYSAILKECDSNPANSTFITVGDSLLQVACFGSRITDMGIFHGGSSANSGVYMIFSNCMQQARFLERVQISGGNRGGINLDTGYGGAALIGMLDIECATGGTVNQCIRLNYASAVVDMQNVITEVAGNNIANNGIALVGGRVNLQNYHCEGYATCIFMNVPVNSGISSFHHLTGTAGTCTNLLTRQSGSASNVNVIGMATGCTNTLNNAGAATTGNIIGDTTF